MKISVLYEHLRARKADLSGLTTAMHQITGDATPNWEDSVMSQAANNVVLNTLYERFKNLRALVRNIGDQYVDVHLGDSFENDNEDEA